MLQEQVKILAPLLSLFQQPQEGVVATGHEWPAVVGHEFCGFQNKFKVNNKQEGMRNFLYPVNSLNLQVRENILTKDYVVYYSNSHIKSERPPVRTWHFLPRHKAFSMRWGWVV